MDVEVSSYFCSDSPEWWKKEKHFRTRGQHYAWTWRRWEASGSADVPSERKQYFICSRSTATLCSQSRRNKDVIFAVIVALVVEGTRKETYLNMLHPFDVGATSKSSFYPKCVPLSKLIQCNMNIWKYENTKTSPRKKGKQTLKNHRQPAQAQCGRKDMSRCFVYT